MWILILILSVARPLERATSAETHHVPGFRTEAACVAAGRRIASRAPSGTYVDFNCVSVGR